MISVEVHSFEDHIDITKWCKSVSYSESLSPPWETISLTLAIPYGILTDSVTRSSRRITPARHPERVELTVDDWLCIRDEGTRRVLAFGKIDMRPTGIRGADQGRIISDPMQIQSVGWLDYIGSSPMGLFPGLSEDVGNYFSAHSNSRYSEFIRLITAGVSSERIEPLLRLLGHMRIPKAILNAYMPTEPVKVPLLPAKRSSARVTRIGDLAHGVYDSATAKKWAPSRVTDKVVGINLGGFRYLSPQGGMLEMLLGMFQPEPRMMEFFPSLEAMSNEQAERGYARVRPCVIHRMRPWRTNPVSQIRQTSAKDEAPNLKTKAFENKTWNVGRALKLGREDMFSLSRIQSESGRCNLVSFIWSAVGMSEPFMLQGAGAPVYDKKSVDDFGVRPLNIRWDFLQFGQQTSYDPEEVLAKITPLADKVRSGTDKYKLGKLDKKGVEIGDLNQSDMLDFLRGVMYQGWQWYGHGQVFENGRISCHYTGPKARPGEIVRVDVGAALPYIAYMERVTHSFSIVNGSAVNALTEIDFTRGLDDEDKRDIHLYVDAPVNKPPLAPAQPTAGTTAPTAPAASTILLSGNDVPFSGISPVKRMLLSDAALRKRQMRNPQTVDMLVAHYTDGKAGSLRTTAYRNGTTTRAAFDKVDSQGGSQFIIATDGTIMQIMDAAMSAGHAGEDDTITSIAWNSAGQLLPQATIVVKDTKGFLESGTILVETTTGAATVTYEGITKTTFTGCEGGRGVIKGDGDVVFYSLGGQACRRSIGVEMVVPSPKRTPDPSADNSPPWPIRSGYSIGYDPPKLKQNRYGPTDEQKRALAELARWANQHMAVALSAPAASISTPNVIYPLWGRAKPVVSTLQPGLWHHCELARNRGDCIGLSLAEIASMAESGS